MSPLARHSVRIQASGNPWATSSRFDRLLPCGVSQVGYEAIGIRKTDGMDAKRVTKLAVFIGVVICEAATGRRVVRGHEDPT